MVSTERHSRVGPTGSEKLGKGPTFFKKFLKSKLTFSSITSAACFSSSLLRERFSSITQPRLVCACSGLERCSEGRFETTREGVGSTLPKKARKSKLTFRSMSSAAAWFTSRTGRGLLVMDGSFIVLTLL